MENDSETQQLVAKLVMHAAARFAEGKTKSEVIAELERTGASPDVAKAIAAQGSLMGNQQPEPESEEAQKPKAKKPKASKKKK